MRRPANRAEPRPVTPDYLQRAALHYLERYASTAANLHRVLVGKARRRLGPGATIEAGIEAAITDVVARAVRSGLVDDRSFAEMKVAALMRRGSSTRAMRQRLKGKGVADDAIASALASQEPDDLALARRHAQRKRLGPYRSPPQPGLRDRDLAALCRAGFAYRIAARALDEAPDDEMPDDPPA